MIARQGDDLKCSVVFKNAGLGVTGLTTTFTVIAPDGTIVANAQAGTEIDSTNLPGWYSYTVNGASVDQDGIWAFKALKTAGGSVDETQLDGYWQVAGWAAVQTECQDALEALDLDHLLKISPGSTKPVAGTYWDQITSKDSNQTFNRATDSLEVLGEKLAQASITVVSTVSGSEITVYRDTKWVISLTDVGDLSDRATSGARVYFTAKVNPDEDTNAEAILQVEESQGLLVFNGSDDVTALDGSITVTDANDGDLTITVKTATTSNAPLITSISADVKKVDTSGEEHRMIGYRFNIKATDTR